MGKCGTANHRLSTKSRYSGEHPANTNSTQQTSWGGQDTTLGAFFGIYLRKKPTERKKQGGLTNKQKWNHTKVQIHPNSSSSDLGELKKGWQRPWTTTSVRMHRFGHFTTIGPVREAADEYCGLEIRRLFSTRQPYKVVTTSNKVKVRPLTTPPTPTWTNNSR